MILQKRPNKIGFFIAMLIASVFIFKDANAAGLTVGNASLNLAAGENLYYGVTSASNANGNFILLEKGAGNAIFKIDYNGNITTNGSLLGSNSYWNLSGSNLYASNTSWNLGIGTTLPQFTFDVSNANSPIISGGEAKLIASFGDNTNHVRISDGKYYGVNGLFDGGISIGYNSYVNLIKNRKVFSGATSDDDYAQLANYSEISLSAPDNEGSVGFDNVIKNITNQTNSSFVFGASNAVSNIGGGTLALAIGSQNSVTSQNTSTITNVTGVNSGLSATSGSTITNAIGISGAITAGAGSVVFDATGLKLTTNSLGGGVVNNYTGLNINEIVAATGNNSLILLGTATRPTGNYSIYNASTFQNYFSGSLGIGSTAPVYKLDVAGTGQFTQPVIVGTPTADSHAATKSYVDSAAASAAGSTWAVNGTNIYNSNSGSVGIGTTTPVGKFEVYSSTANGFITSSDTAATWISMFADNGVGNAISWSNNQPLRFSTVSAKASGAGWAELMRIQPNGNIGIGSTAPAFKLDVAGTGQFTQPVIVGTPTVANHAATKGYVDSVIAPIGGGSGTVGYWNANGNNIYSVNSGNVGIGTTASGAKLNVAGGVRIYNGNSLAFGRDTGNTDFSSFIDAYGYPSGGYAAGGSTNYWLRLSSLGGTHIVLNTDGGAGAGENAYDHLVVWQGAVDGDKLLDVSNVGNTYIKGNLGIGSTAPSAALDVFGKVKTTSGGTIYNTDSSRWLDMTGTLTDSLRVSGNIITTAGNVGIGINSPAYPLHLYKASSETGIKTSWGSSDIFLSHGGWGMGAGKFGIGNGGSPTLVVDGNNNYVGIGTTNPTALLTVGDLATSATYSHTFPNATTWLNLCTVADISDTTIIATIGASNSEERATINVKTTYYGNNSFIKVERQTYNPRLLEVRVDGNNGGSKTIYVKIRGGDYTPYINWKIVNTQGLASVNNTEVDPSNANNTDLLMDTANLVTMTTGNFDIMSGNVGIGTTAPNAALDVFGKVKTTSGGTIYNTDSSRWLDMTGTLTDSLRVSGNIVTTAGNVGIGTTGPAAKLHVVTSVSSAMKFDRAGSNTYGFEIGGTTFGLYDYTNTAYRWRTNGTDLILNESTGNVGIGTTSPDPYKLYVNGSAYVSGSLTLADGANLAMPNSTLTVNKLTVNTIDPLYNIKGINYSSFAASVVGGVKEEVTGKINIKNKVDDEYQAVINFDNQIKGSDLWVWYSVVDFSKDNVEAIITPYGGFANVYYSISGHKLVFHSNQPVEASYRLLAKRFDWKQWPTKAKDQKEKAGFYIK